MKTIKREEEFELTQGPSSGQKITIRDVIIEYNTLLDCFQTKIEVSLNVEPSIRSRLSLDEFLKFTR